MRPGDLHAIALVAALLPSLAACASQTGFGRASTLERGKVQAQAAVTASVASVQMSPGTPVPLPWLDVEAGVHYGLTDDFELGARLWGIGIRGLATWGVAADTKLRLVRSGGEGDGGDDAARGWHLSVALSPGYHQILFGGTPTHLFTLTLPVLIGFDVGRSQLVFGPRVVGNVWTGQGQGAIETISGGLSVGWSIALGRKWTIMPEVVLLWSPVSFNGEVDDEDQTGAGFLHVGVGGPYEL